MTQIIDEKKEAKTPERREAEAFEERRCAWSEVEREDRRVFLTREEREECWGGKC